MKYYLACGQYYKPNYNNSDFQYCHVATDYNRDSNVIVNDVTIANKHSRISDVTVVIYLRIIDVTRDVYTSCDVTATVHASCDVTTTVHSSCDVTAAVYTSCDNNHGNHNNHDVTNNNNSCAKHNNYCTISNEQ